jgi:O-Antigen ligase
MPALPIKGERRDPQPTRPMMIAAAAGVSIVIGYAVSHGEIALCVVVSVIAVVGAFAKIDLQRFRALALAVLPWLVLTIDVTPRLTLTLTAAFVAAILLFPVPADVGELPWVAVFMFGAIILAQVVESVNGDQRIEAAKYALFPAMVIVAASARRRAQLIEMRGLLLASGLAAMAVDEVDNVLHLGKLGSYYGAGEELGLAAESPHEIALIGVMVCVACLLTVRDVRLRFLGAALAAIPALATGVRSALVALVVSLVVLVIKAGFRPSAVVGVVVIGAAVIFSGAGTIITSRFANSERSGEFSSFADAGSGRGTIWTVALHEWSTSGPAGMAFGSGLRSVDYANIQQLKKNLVAQSDFVAVLVELGVFGVVAWVLMWLALIRSGINWLVLLPLASYGLTNGAIEYVGAVVFGIALSAACSDRTAMPTRETEHGMGTSAVEDVRKSDGRSVLASDAGPNIGETGVWDDRRR